MREALVAWRKKNGLTQSKAAKVFGVSRSFWGLIEQGKRNPRLDLAKRISDKVQVPLEKLFF